jgi:exopolyphosphatase/guanosine-5'-triphosphate,3'-diphosphate pyrophosphatase
MSHEARGVGLFDPADRGLRLASVQEAPAATAQGQTSGRRRASRHSQPTYAALDLGTNNCRLLIARPTGDAFRVIDAFSRIIRLGEGVSITRRIGAPAIERAIEALAVCRDKMAFRGVSRARLIATAACRIADNGPEFCDRVNEELGLDLEIVDHATEAELAATGCTPLMDPASRGAILFDIGGGSSELVRLGPSDFSCNGPPKPAIQGWISLPLGVVTLAERFGGVCVTPETFATMVEAVAAELADFSAVHGGDLADIHMLGTSGTVTTIAGVFLNLLRYDRRRVDGCWLGAQEITAVIERLMAMSYQDRAANPCIGIERADLVLTGCAILEAIRRAFPCPRLRVADRGLREGMLVKMMRADGVWDVAGAG